MINTLFSLDALGTPAAFLLASLVGFGFGFALERAGFSSSRRLAGVFYFTDMTVVKVMFTGLITALLGLSYLEALGWIEPDRIFLMPTIYGAQVAGGLLFGLGFVMGAWCPGTAAAGLAAGRLDALLFLGGAVGGSILFNEWFPHVRGLYMAGDRGVQFVHDALGLSRRVFVLSFTGVAVGAFWLAEWAERARTGRAPYLGTPFLKAFSLALVVGAGGLFILPARAVRGPVAAGTERALMQAVELAADHIEPEELADRLMAGEPGLVVVDVRPRDEFERFHLRGARNVALPDLADVLAPHRNQGTIVLYSNGMTHPAQARDSLQRQGFGNVRILTDGVQGFRERCLKPVSLRSAPLPAPEAERVKAWRAFFSC
jgi:thiosulfate/3-mercaptopyruvate sulfurtransferase